MSCTWDIIERKVREKPYFVTEKDYRYGGKEF